MAAPILLGNPAGGHWTRSAFFDWLEALLGSGVRVLAGFDFAPAYPHCDQGSYFPGLDGQPDHALALWSLVERVCAADSEFYGGAFYQRKDLPYHRHFLSPYGRGDLYAYRQRQAELACAAITSPHPVIKCIGAANVGTGSLAGMRFLHRLLARNQHHAIAWPFQPIDHRSVLVEIFPRFCYMRAGANPRRWADPSVINQALAFHGSEPVAKEFKPAREDESDAIVIAAALRALAISPEVWAPPAMTARVAATEGWIFGVL